MDSDQLWLVLLVGIGGASGSIARYLFSGYFTTGDFPWGTFFVNATGSFMIAFLYFWGLNAGFLQPELRVAVFVGVFGGYTTTSAFSLETVSMISESQWGWAFGNIILNGGVCIVAAVIGRAAGLLMEGG
ncbi:MAG: CrcB family protein [Thermoplasmata archaeon]|nr:CrcB family protein [Thermoplasmata archaeon]MBU1157774.1 CrcB family protein [Candidatus Thermoplasmatota archaeon]MCJ7562728.1 CrcB family protein [Thermoplasmata archaeon]